MVNKRPVLTTFCCFFANATVIIIVLICIVRVRRDAPLPGLDYCPSTLFFGYSSSFVYGALLTLPSRHIFFLCCGSVGFCCLLWAFHLSWFLFVSVCLSLLRIRFMDIVARRLFVHVVSISKEVKTRIRYMFWHRYMHGSMYVYLHRFQLFVSPN